MAERTRPPDFVETALLAETLLPLLGVAIPGENAGESGGSRRHRDGGRLVPRPGQLLMNKCLHLDGVKERLSAMFEPEQQQRRLDDATASQITPAASLEQLSASGLDPSPPEWKKMRTLSPLIARRLSPSKTLKLLPEMPKSVGGDADFVSHAEGPEASEDSPVLLLPSHLQAKAAALSPRRTSPGRF